MVDIYKTDNKVLSKLDNIEDGCWINMVNPTSSELSLVSGYFDIDADDLATALDEEESSRKVLRMVIHLYLLIFQRRRSDMKRKCIQQFLLV